MKNLILALSITAVLFSLFSCLDYRPTEKPNGYGYGTKYKGDSGLILPGNGEEMENTSIEPGSIPELVEKEVVSKMEIATEATVSETESVAANEKITEEHNKMNEMIIAFWHGVAAVLIGEASALMVAFAWMKIRGGK